MSRIELEFTSAVCIALSECAVTESVFEGRIMPNKFYTNAAHSKCEKQFNANARRRQEVAAEAHTFALLERFNRNTQTQHQEQLVLCTQTHHPNCKRALVCCCCSVIAPRQQNFDNCAVEPKRVVQFANGAVVVVGQFKFDRSRSSSSVRRMQSSR